jgi:hypothetical protein
MNVQSYAYLQVVNHKMVGLPEIAHAQRHTAVRLICMLQRVQMLYRLMGN